MNDRPGSSDDYHDVTGLVARMATFTDEKARAALRADVVTRCLPLADHIARRFTGRGLPQDDLVQVARLGLVSAVDRFDPDRGAEFVAFAVPTIMGEVRRYFRDSGWALHVPRRMKELHLAINQATPRLSQSLGRAPTPHELAADLDVDPEVVAEALVAGNAYQTVSAETPASDEAETPFLDTIGAYDDDLEHVDEHETLQPLLAQLPDRERTILLMRFFGNLTQTQIAERVGLSQMHVSRILARTLETLRAQLLH